MEIRGSDVNFQTLKYLKVKKEKWNTVSITCLDQKHHLIKIKDHENSIFSRQL